MLTIKTAGGIIKQPFKKRLLYYKYNVLRGE